MASSIALFNGEVIPACKRNQWNSFVQWTYLLRNWPSYKLFSTAAAEEIEKTGMKYSLLYETM
jgi:hypothetical protein